MSKLFFCREVRFTASHYYALPGLSPEENKAKFGSSAEPHVHHWALTLWLEGVPDSQTGMIADLVLIDEVLQKTVTAPFDGKSFREGDPEFFSKHQPTNEVLAGYFAEKVAASLPNVRLAKVRIAESPDIFAEWWA